MNTDDWDRIEEHFSAPRWKAVQAEAAARVSAGVTVHRVCHSDACASGDKPCPTPTACEVSEPEWEAMTGPESVRFWAAVLAIPAVVAIIGFAAVVAR